LTRSILNY